MKIVSTEKIIEINTDKNGVIKLEIPTDFVNKSVCVKISIEPIEDVTSSPINYMEKARQKHKKAYQSWTPEEEQNLVIMWENGLSIKSISEELERQPGAIRSRLRKILPEFRE